MKITREWMNKHWLVIFAFVCVALMAMGMAIWPSLEPTNTRPRSAGVSSAERAAIKAVQEYTLDGTNTVSTWLLITLLAKGTMGDNIDLDDAYWAARENGQRFQVRFHYKEDGRWQYAEWRYVPSSGLVFGENQLGQMTVR